jgi:uncharacterized membrane protein
MTIIFKNIEIKAPIKKVYTYVNNPKNAPDWFPNMSEVKNVTGSGAGTHYEWAWKMGGFGFNGESTTIQDIPGKKIVIKSKGKHGMESKWSYNFNNKGDTTLFDLALEYSVPTRVSGKPVEKVIMKNNERDVGLALMNIKNRMEERMLEH